MNSPVSFTIAEYIVMEKLNVDATDTAVTRKIALHLKSLGYVAKRVRTSIGDGKYKSQIVWAKDNRKEMLEDLDVRLAAIKKREGKK